MFNLGPPLATLLRRVDSYPPNRLKGQKGIRGLVARLIKDLRALDLPCLPRTRFNTAMMRLVVDTLPKRLADIAPAERFVTDPRLRERLVREVLAGLCLRPARESPARAQNRLNELTRADPGSAKSWMLGLAYDVWRGLHGRGGRAHWYGGKDAQALKDLAASWPGISERKWRWALRRADKLEPSAYRIIEALDKKKLDREQALPNLQRACPGFPRESYGLALDEAGHIAFMESIK